MTHRSAQVSLVTGAALIMGFAEAALIAGSWLGARGAFQYVPPRMWLVVPLCWLVSGAVLALIVRPVAAVMAMIVLFATVRLGLIGLIPATIGCVAAFLIARRWLQRPRRVEAKIAVAITVVLIVGLSLHWGKELPRRAFDAAAPDVLVVFLDTVSYDAVFPRGGEVDPSLPALARLAKESVVFDRAYSTSSWTLPAHLSAVTGLPAHRLRVGLDHQNYELSTPTLAERFRRRGYRTAAVISNSFLNPDSGFQRGFDSFEQSCNALDLCRTAPGVLADRYWPWFAATVCNWSASEVTDRALRYLNGDKQPLFLVLNYMDAHDPYYSGSKTPWPREVPPAAYRARYYGSHIAALRGIDRQLGRLFDRFGRDAIIAVVADHGEQFGDHGLVRHGNSLYAQLLHVPLMIRRPQIPPRRISEPVSITILPQLVEGNAAATAQPIVSYLSKTQWSVIRDRWHYIADGEREELYDLAADPRELNSLPVLEALRLEAKRQQALMETETRSRFRSIGYVR